MCPACRKSFATGFLLGRFNSVGSVQEDILRLCALYERTRRRRKSALFKQIMLLEDVGKKED